MTTPAAAVLSHELTRERGDNSRDLLAVSWETEDQFLQLVTSGEELRPRRFGDLQPRLHVCKTCRVQNKKVTGPGKTCRVQNKKVPGLGKNMPCAKIKGSWFQKKSMPCAKNKGSVSKQLVLRPPKLISQNRDPHSAGISVKVGIPIWARLFMSRLLTNLDY